MFILELPKFRLLSFNILMTNHMYQFITTVERITY